jgi:hypothetical protein
VYDDAITYQIATTLSEEMNMTLSQVLTFGEWWVVHTTSEKYPA